MSDNKPLMPLATAVWLVDNTALSFSQISQFCQLHELEVKCKTNYDIHELLIKKLEFFY